MQLPGSLQQRLGLPDSRKYVRAFQISLGASHPVFLSKHFLFNPVVCPTYCYSLLSQQRCSVISTDCFQQLLLWKMLFVLGTL